MRLFFVLWLEGERWWSPGGGFGGGGGGGGGMTLPFPVPSAPIARESIHLDWGGW